jgi:ATP-dependent Clp endopeptidase proteolytic subunit ClpP
LVVVLIGLLLLAGTEDGGTWLPAVFSAATIRPTPSSTDSISAAIATFLLASGTPGKRFALPNATIHFHPAGVSQLGGYAPDVEIHVRFLLDLQERANRLMAEYTGQPYETIVQDFARDKFFTAEEARRYGLIDAVAGAEIIGRNGAATEGSIAA